MISRLTDQVKASTQLFLDELWKQSDKGQKVVDIDIGELKKIDDHYEYIAMDYLIYLRKIGCVVYDYDYLGEHCLVAVKSNEATGNNRKGGRNDQ